MTMTSISGQSVSSFVGPFIWEKKKWFPKDPSYHWSELHHMFLPRPVVGKRGGSITQGVDQSRFTLKLG